MTTAYTTQGQPGGYGGPQGGGRPPLPPRRRFVSSLFLLLVLLALLLLLPATEAIKRASTPSTPAAAGSKPSPPTPPSSTTPTTTTKKSKALSKKLPTASARKAEETCEPESEPTATPTSQGGGLTIHLLLSDGQKRVLSLPASTTPHTLRHHLLAQGLVVPHQAEGLRLRRLKKGGRPVTQGLTTASELQNGDTILLPSPSSNPSSSSSSSSSSSTSSSFAPYPKHAYAQKKGGRPTSFRDMELYKVVKQDKPFLTLASVNPSSLSSFISRLPIGARRVGLLYGWLQEEGREEGKKEGHVAAVLEVEEEWQEHNSNGRLDDRGLYQLHHHSHSSSSSLPSSPPSPSSSSSHHTNPTLARAARVAAALGWGPIGWILARPGGGGEGGKEGGKEGGFLNGQEVLVTARLQIEAMKQPPSSLPPSFGSSFLTLSVNTSAVFEAQHPVEAFQVSQQAVQMVWDGLIAEGGVEGQVKTTSDVFVSGDTRREVDTALFTLPLAIAPASTPPSLPSSAPSSIIRNTLPPLKDDEDLRAALLGRSGGNRWLETRDKKLLAKLADFHLLVYLAKYLRTDDLTKLCSAILALGGGGGGGREGGKGKKAANPTVPPAVRALLEALCEEG